MAGTMVERLLTIADDLVEERPRSAAFRRRAVSSAYYAVFHSLAKLCAETLLPDAPRDGTEYRRVYRALDHGPLKNAFTQAPLNGHPRLAAIGRAVIVLQSERNDADYQPPNAHLFPLQRVRELIDQARQILARINDLNADDRRLLATSLLFKARST